MIDTLTAIKELNKMIDDKEISEKLVTYGRFCGDEYIHNRDAINEDTKALLRDAVQKFEDYVNDNSDNKQLEELIFENLMGRL